MHDSSLMGLQLFLLLLLSQKAWAGQERSHGGQSMRSPSALLMGQGSRLRGHVHPCLPLPDLVRQASFPRGGRKTGMGRENLSLPLGKSPWFPPAGCRIALGANGGFPACWLGRVRWRHPVCSVVKPDLILFCDSDLILPASFLPTSSSRSQLCVTFSPCLKPAMFPQLPVGAQSSLMADGFQGPPMHAVFSVPRETEA